MRVAILQPGYLPWLGFFEQMARADVFVLYDDVQFDKHGWRNRNRIRTPAGSQWLTVPVRTAGCSGDRIMDMRIDAPRPWAAKHRNALRANYARAPHFEWCFSQLEPILDQKADRLVELCLQLQEALAACLRIHATVVRSSTLNISGGQTERLVRICRHFDATEYYSGSAARNYLDIGQFDAARIRVVFQEYVHPVYTQGFQPFVSHLSVVDLLMNCGPAARGILLGTPDSADRRHATFAATR
jgi:hypothetical protein